MLLAIEHELHESHELFAVQILSHALVRFVRLVVNQDTKMIKPFGLNRKTSSAWKAIQRFLCFCIPFPALQW